MGICKTVCGEEGTTLHVLIVEDERNVARFIQSELKHAGYHVTVVEDGEEALQRLREENIDALILDWMLPGLSGIEIAQKVRSSEKTRDLPIIMLTAKDAVEDRVYGLKKGADDYVVKPFAIEELLARLEALLRRSQAHIEVTTETMSTSTMSTAPRTSDRSKNSAEDAMLTNHSNAHPRLNEDGVLATRPKTLHVRNLTIDVSGVQAFIDDQPVEFTAREFDLLTYLARNAGRVLTRDEILNEVWGYDVFVETNVVDVYIRYIRQKLAKKGAPDLIETVRGKGYVMRL